MEDNEIQSGANDFAAMYEKSFAGMGRLEPGQMIETQIVSISGESVFLHLNGKSEGVMDSAELLDKDGDLTVQVGDTIKAYFLRAQNGEMRFTTRITGKDADNSLLENAFKAGIPVEGLVNKEIKGGYEVLLGQTRAFCPYSQMGLKRAEDSSACVGTTLSFRILEFSENGRRVLVSNRVLLEAEHEEKLTALRKTLEVGQLVTGTVTSIRDFGAFVELGGVQALIPVSELSRARVKDVGEVLSAGQEVQAKLIALDWQSERITLSLKALEADPWDTAAERYPKGSRHKGTVARITPYGAFVTLESGLDGLVHVSELRGDGPYNNTADSLKTGQTLSVRVLDVDSERKRISLKPAVSAEEEKTVDAYMHDEEEGGDTYNPFAALLKKGK